MININININMISFQCIYNALREVLKKNFCFFEKKERIKHDTNIIY